MFSSTFSPSRDLTQIFAIYEEAYKLQFSYLLYVFGHYDLYMFMNLTKLTSLQVFEYIIGGVHVIVCVYPLNGPYGS